MITEVKELEKILNQEIEAYSRLERYIIDKKESLVSGDIDKLRNIDCEIEKIASETEILEKQRTQVTRKFGNENLTLKEIIEKIEQEDKTEKISGLRQKLKNIGGNIARQNKINAQLIEHSLRIIEYSVISIANILMPEASSYNNFGKIKGSNNKPGVSSVIHEA